MDNQQIYDDIDYRAMQDFTRYISLGKKPAELVAADTAAHELVCETVKDYVKPSVGISSPEFEKEFDILQKIRS